VPALGYHVAGRWLDSQLRSLLSDGGGLSGYRLGNNSPTGTVKATRTYSDTVSGDSGPDAYGSGPWGSWKRGVGESVRWAVGDERLSAASDAQLITGTVAFSAGVAMGGYGALAAFGVVGTGAVGATLAAKSLAAGGSLLAYGSAGLSTSQFMLGAGNGDDVVSDLASLGIELTLGKARGIARGTLLAADAAINAYQGRKSLEASYGAYAQGDYIGASVSLVGAGLGLGSAGIRGAQFHREGFRFQVVGGNNVFHSGVPIRIGQASVSGVAELGLSKATARQRLNTALGSVVGDGKAGHHLLPLEAISDPRTANIVGAAARGGFSINGANNGVLLSQLVHRGGHPKAIERMIRKVSGLSGTDVQIATNLQGILDVERTFLQTIEASRLAAAQAGRGRIFLK